MEEGEGLGVWELIEGSCGSCGEIGFWSCGKGEDGYGFDGGKSTVSFFWIGEERG